MGLKPQPPAEPKILLRRLHLDLIGLPPTTEQLLTNASYEDTVDQLLASPHYGERWGRHWMDVWRYSDWYGLGGMLRHSQKHLWHWRDWIINSLNKGCALFTLLFNSGWNCPATNQGWPLISIVSTTPNESLTPEITIPAFSSLFLYLLFTS